MHACALLIAVFHTGDAAEGMPYARSRTGGYARVRVPTSVARQSGRLTDAGAAEKSSSTGEALPASLLLLRLLPLLLHLSLPNRHFQLFCFVDLAPRPQHKFYVVGNHEYIHGNGQDVRPWEAYFRQALNFTTLHNSGVQLSGATSFPVRDCTHSRKCHAGVVRQCMICERSRAVRNQTGRGGVAPTTTGWPSWACLISGRTSPTFQELSSLPGCMRRVRNGSC